MFGKNSRILIVDDMKTMRLVLKKSLKDLGFENVSEADDGSTAWPLIEQAISAGQPFDVILSDWNMPKMQGIDLLKKVRSHPAIATMPFVLVTAESEKSQVMEAAQRGVTGFVMKPFTTESLQQRLADAHKKSGKG